MKLNLEINIPKLGMQAKNDSAHTVTRDPIIDGFPQLSEHMENRLIPSANFWSESPTYKTNTMSYQKLANDVD